MTKKNIFVYKLFLSLNISDFSFFFLCKNCNLLPPTPEKSYSSFSSNPLSQSWGLVNLPPPSTRFFFFENLVGRRFNPPPPPQQKGRGGGCTLCYVLFFKSVLWRLTNSSGWEDKGFFPCFITEHDAYVVERLFRIECNKRIPWSHGKSWW